MYSRLKKMSMDNAIESSSSNALVVHEIKSTQPPESKPMPININVNNHTRKFDWIIYKYTIKQLNINAEYKALRHFNKYARPGSSTHVKYLRNLYGIMPYFNEKVYMEYTNLNPNITLEQLYIYFRSEGYKRFPLNEKYDKLFYNIESVFDVDTYYECYRDEIDNYLYSDDNYDANSDDWETGSQISSITSMSNVSTMSIATIQTRNSMLSGLISNANNHRRGIIESHEDREMQTIQNQYNDWKENLYNWYDIPDTLNKKVYKFYKEHKETHTLNNKYFMLKYKITEPLFDLSLYCKINNINYNKTNINEIDNTYLLFSKNKKLDDNYYKAYYNIPEDLDFKTFIKRYDVYFEDKQEYLQKLDQEQKNYIYMVFDKLRKSNDFCYFDSYYYRILHNIPDDFNYNIYISCYPELKEKIKKINLKNVNIYTRISKEEKHIYENIEKYTTEFTLGDTYYRLLYNIPLEFDYFLFINTYPELIEINNLKDESIINELSDFVRDSILLDDKKILYKYYNLNRNKYALNEYYFKKYYYKLYNIPVNINENVFIDMYIDLKTNILSIELDNNKNNYYRLYYNFIASKLDEVGLNNLYYEALDKYYRLKYNIPDDFECDLYLKTYPEHLENIKSTNNKYEFNKQIYEKVDLNNMPLEDKYYRLKYNIPDLLDPIVYVKRYPDIKDELINLQDNTLEYNKKVYELCETLLNYFKLDDKYFMIKYNISFLFHLDSINIFKDKYNIKYEKEYNNNYYGFGEEGQYKIDLLSDDYLKILFNLSDEFNWYDYYNSNKIHIDNSSIDIELNENDINKIKSYCYFSTKNTKILDYISNYKIDKKKYYNIDSSFDYLIYSEKFPYFYMNTRINVTPDFVYMFYNNKITLENIYNLFKNNIQHPNIQILEINEFMIKNEEKYIENYEYLISSKIFTKHYKDFFVLKDYLNNIEKYTDNKFNKDDIVLLINTERFLGKHSFFNLYKTLNYNVLLSNFEKRKITFSEEVSDLSIAYVYQSFNNCEFDIVNFIYSIQYIPSNIKVYILTNHNLFDNIIGNNIIKINYSKKNKLLLPNNIDEEHVFIWNSNYIMESHHIFLKKDIISDILVSNTIPEYINVGILRKNDINNIINIDNTTDLIKFRKHNKYNFLIK